MILWTSDDALKATGGRGQGPVWAASGVSIDTRSLAPGDLFVALTAVRDGHDFVAQALEKGAAAALVSRVPEGVAPDAPLLIVDDVLSGLEALGRAARERTQARIAAITGSVGKTSTKEMLRAALVGQGHIHVAEASYNNHWGVPLTLARMPADTDFAVFEIGMNAPGEIAPLARQVRPHVVMVTTIAAAHLEAFPDLDAIAREKISIVEGLEPNGVAVLNADLAQSPILIDGAQGHRVVTFGTVSAAHHRLTKTRIAEGHTVGVARGWRTPLMLNIATEGRHFALNALGVLAVVRALGADRARALCGLATWAPPRGRGQREMIVLDGQVEGESFELIDDAFNANPTSLSAALDVLAAAQPVDGVGRVSRGRRVAILGDMLELGPDAHELHAAMAQDPAMRQIHMVHTVGPLMRALHDALPETQRGRHVATPDALMRDLSRLVDSGDIVLVKGSKGSFVSRLVDGLRKLGQTAPFPEET